MKLLLSLSLWIALVLTSGRGESEPLGGDEDEELTTPYYDYDYPTVTGTPEYDYNATFDYYFVTGFYEVKSKACVIGHVTPLLLLLLLGLAAVQLSH